MAFTACYRWSRPMLVLLFMSIVSSTALIYCQLDNQGLLLSNLNQNSKFSFEENVFECVVYEMAIALYKTFYINYDYMSYIVTWHFIHTSQRVYVRTCLPEAGIKAGGNPTDAVGCNYLSMTLIPAFDTKVHLQNMNTCPYPWYLLLAYKSTYVFPGTPVNLTNQT